MCTAVGQGGAGGKDDRMGHTLMCTRSGGLAVVKMKTATWLAQVGTQAGEERLQLSAGCERDDTVTVLPTSL